MKQELVLITFCVLTQVARGQRVADSLKFNDFGLSSGMSHISLVDQTFSPITYRGAGLLVGLQYTHRHTRSKQSVSIGANQQTLKPRFNLAVRNTLGLTNIQINYHYARLLRLGKWKTYLGSGLHNFLSFRTFSIERNQEIGYDSFSSLNLVASLDRQLRGRHALELKSTYALLAYVIGRMRIPKDWPPEVAQALLQNPESLPVGAILKSGNVLTLNRFVEFTFQTNYKVMLSKRFTLGLSYWFRYYRYPKYLKKVVYGESQFQTGLLYTF